MTNAPQPADPSSTRPESAPGADLSGRTLGDFQLVRLLGQGGMGQVYLAEQLSLRRKVALKVLRADLAADTTYLQRFKIEAEAAARANHANIVQVHFIGSAEGLHYIALEYVEGRTLRDYLEKKGPPETPICLSIMRQVAAGLQRAHELGIVHRDVKPENILLTRKGEVKVADFGLSRIFAPQRISPSLTQSNVTMGTPLYMSPEQVENRNVDCRSDIYSFGVTCYHLLSGRPPFRGETAFELVLQHVQKEPPPLAEVRPDLPAELCTLVHRMMAKRPEDRTQTCRDVLREVARIREKVTGVTAGDSAPVVALGPVEPSPDDVARTQPVPGRRRRGLRWLVAATLILALGAGVLLGWVRRREMPAGTAVGSEPGASAMTVSKKKKDEELLRQTVRTLAQSGTPHQGLPIAVDLAVHYLKDRRLDEADEFFAELTQTRYKRYYHALGNVGKAMVLAFRDHPRASNLLFEKLVSAKTKGQNSATAVQKSFWSAQPQLRELIAEALNHNYANAPAAFPSRLQPLRNPPPPLRIENKPPAGPPSNAD